MPAQRQRFWDAWAGTSQCQPRGRDSGTTSRRSVPHRNASPEAEILGRPHASPEAEILGREIGPGPGIRQPIAMPAQRQRFWDASGAGVRSVTPAKRVALRRGVAVCRSEDREAASSRL